MTNKRRPSNIGLSENERGKVEMIRTFFGLNTHGGAVRKAIALIAAIVTHIGDDRRIIFVDKQGKECNLIFE